MEQQKFNIKKGLYVLVLALLLIPAVLHVFKVGSYKTLGGVFLKTEQLPLSFNSIKTGAYQDSFQKNLKDNFFARAPFVRLRNQLDFWMYDTLHAGDVYYYEGQFFRFYMYNYSDEMGFEGWDVNAERLRKLKVVRDTLAKYNTEIVSVITPSKGHYYVDKVKAHFFRTNRWSNLAVIDSLYKMSDLNYINFDDWFLEMKETVERPLFGSGGIHWNQYGATLALDSLLHFLSTTSIKEKINFPRWKLSSSHKQLALDMDLLNTANLYFKYKDTALRMVEIQANSPKNDLKVIVNSDSYFDVISWTNLRKTYFGVNSEYRYYNRVNYDANSVEIPLTKLTKEQLIEQDLVLIMYSIPNLTDYSRGMIDELYDVITK
ncbi:MAG: alginate O-acetyltransferase AlgX-related protein [Lishizhenia sp.]